MPVSGKKYLLFPARAGGLALDFILPLRCLCCDARVASRQALCAACWTDLPFLERPWCHRLGTPFAYDVGDGAWSPQAIAAPPLFDRLRAVAHYEGPARQLVLALKFSRRRELARPMARWMARSGAEILDPDCLLVPVPLHWTRLLSRRFNQAADLAREVALETGAHFEPQLLRRRRRTRQQVGLSAQDRRRNVRTAFALDPERAAAAAGRRIVLVDDVLTTGSTVEACTRRLLAAGAASVDVLTFALADPASRSVDRAV
ncbi:MAG: ComF family protein [Roseibium sp.]